MNGLTFDDHNLIYNNDTGDTAAETGRYYAGLWLTKYVLQKDISKYPFNKPEDFKEALKKLEFRDGIFVRHPTSQWNDPNDFSRDQQVPLEIAMSFYNRTFPGMGFDSIYRRLREKQDDRLFKKYQNWDFPNPSSWTIFERSIGGANQFKARYADFFLLGQSFIQSHFKDQTDVADDLNHTLLCIHSTLFMPNSWSDRAINYYTDHRKANPGDWNLSLMSPIYGPWSWYYRPSSSTLYGMPELWLPILNKFFV